MRAVPALDGHEHALGFRQRQNRETAPEGQELAVTLEDTQLAALIRRAVRLEVRKMQRTLNIAAVVIGAAFVGLCTYAAFTLWGPS